MTNSTAPRRALVRVADFAVTWLIRVVGVCASGVLAGASIDRAMSRGESESRQLANSLVVLISAAAVIYWFELIVLPATRQVKSLIWRWYLNISVGLAYFFALVYLLIAGFRLTAWCGEL